MRLLSLAALLVPAVATAAPPPVTAVAYQPDGKVVAAGVGGEVRLFDPQKPQAASQAAVSGRVTSLAFDPTGKRLAVACGEAGKAGEVRVFALTPDGRLGKNAPFVIAAHKDAIYTLAWHPDGKTLATAGYDRLIHLWDVPANGKPGESPRLTLTDHSDAVYAVAFDPDGTRLASASADRSVKVWDTATGKRLYTLSDAADWVYCLAWDPKGMHLAAGGADRSVRVWVVGKDGARLTQSAFAHEKPVWRLAYTADGGLLYTTGEDRVIKAWEVPSAKLEGVAAKLTETRTFAAQPEVILDTAVRPDGKQLAVARFDGALLLLDPATGKPTAQLLPTRPVPPPAPQPPALKLAQPKPERLTPNGGPRGVPTRVVVTGQNLGFVKRVTANSPAVRVAIGPGERTPGRIEIDVTPDAKAPVGGVQLTFEGDGSKSAPVPFAIDRFVAVPEVGATDSARVGQTVKLPVTLVGAIDRAGDADFFRFNAKAGDEVGVQVVAAEIGSKLDPALVLTDAGGTVLMEGAGVLGFRVPKAGVYAVGVRDKEYRGGPDFTYRLHAGSVPVVTGVFPLAAQRGRTTEVHIEGVNISSQSGLTAKVTVPPDAVAGSRIGVPMSTNSEVPLGKPEVVVAEFPSVVAGGPEGADIRVPGSADGILTRPGETQTLRFTAKKGRALVVEALARRAGSPVDPVIEILDGNGKPVPRALLRSTAKTYSTFRDHDSASPGIRLETWNDLAIDDYLFIDGDLMRIVALPKGPDDDCQFYQVGGQRVGFLGTTPGHHALGQPMYKVEFHPPGKVLPPNGLPAFTLFYRNDDGGAGFGKDSFLMFDPPADGTYQVRVADARGDFGSTHAYRVTVRPPRPDFSAAFNPTTPAVWKGGGVPVAVTVTRVDGFAGPVRVKLEALPAGFSAPETFVEAGQTTTAFTLSASPDATVPAGTNLKLVARATIDGKEVVREAAGGVPTLRTGGDLVTTTRQTTIAIHPGQETKFTVDIQRQGAFAGRVPVEVRGLPHGVRVLNIGLNGILITERETSREVTLYAEPWVKPMEHPVVVLARSEKSGTDHPAPSVLLKVGK